MNNINMANFRIIANTNGDYEIDCDGNVFSHKTNKIMRARIEDGYKRISLIMANGKKQRHFIHRLVAAAYLDDYDDSKPVDHIDSNRLNNHISNLRMCTIRQNNFNTRKIDKPTTSLYKGVHLNRKSGKYHAMIRINGHKTYIGQFKTEEAAAMAYNAAATQHFGEFAQINDFLPQFC